MSYQKINCNDRSMAHAYNIFVESPGPHQRFKTRDGWSEILVPGDFTHSGKEDGICHIVSSLAFQRGSSQLCVKVLYAVSMDSTTCFRVNASMESIFELYDYEELLLPDYIVFDDSADWGVYSYGNEFGYTAVGGCNEFMREVVTALGGLDKLRSDFAEYEGVDDRILRAARASCKWPT